MPKMLLLALAGAATILAGCQSLSPAEVRARDEARCQSYGFKYGTDGMAQCLLDIDLDRNAESRAMQARMHRDLFMARPVVVERRIIVRER